MPSGVAPPQPWILSRHDDLLWFQGSVAAGLGLLAFFLAAPHLDGAGLAPGRTVVLAVFLWGVLFDGTHVWGTYARSYLAPDAASRAGLPGPGHGSSSASVRRLLSSMPCSRHGVRSLGRFSSAPTSGPTGT